MKNLAGSCERVVRALIMLFAFLPGVLSGVAAADSPSNKGQTKAGVKKAATTLPVLRLADAHLGAEYGFRIRGLTGVDVTDFQCSVVPELPEGLTLDCAKLIITGRPTGELGMRRGELWVFDSSGHRVAVSYEIHVVDHPDEGWIGSSKLKRRVPAAELSPTIVAPVAPVVMPEPKVEEARPVAEVEKPKVIAVGGLGAVKSVTLPRAVAVAKAKAKAVMRSASASGANGFFAQTVSIGSRVATATDPSLHEGESKFSIVLEGVTGAVDLEIQVHDADGPANSWSAVPFSIDPSSVTNTRQRVTPGAGATSVEVQLQLRTALAAGQTVRPQLILPDGTPAPVSAPSKVYTALTITAPVIESELLADAVTITGKATPSIANATVNIAVVSDNKFDEVPRFPDSNGRIEVVDQPFSACITPQEFTRLSSHILPQSTGATTTASYTATKPDGSFTLQMVNELVEGERLHVVQIVPENALLTPVQLAKCMTQVTTVTGKYDWGRIHADFVGGVLISNDSTGTATSGTTPSGNFSQAHQFYALSVEKVWSLPGCYLRVPGWREATGLIQDKCYDWDKKELYPAKKMQHLIPGVSTYFQTRLTAIPVSTIASNNTMNSMTTTPTSNLISTAQTAKVEVGAYLPHLVSRWEYNHHPNALFLAPLAKVGFDTVTGPSTVTTIAAGNVVQQQTFEQVYNFWSYGARIGHMELTRSASRAPEVYSYLDIAIGPYSSLQSYICQPAKTGFPPATSTGTQTTCSQYTDIGDAPVDSRKRLYRFDIEGLLKLPRTPLYVGLNANIGQKSLGAGHLDRGFAAPDDLRFFFGTKFDIAAVMMKFLPQK
jgi:hypothetical protein